MLNDKIASEVAKKELAMKKYKKKRVKFGHESEKNFTKGMCKVIVKKVMIVNTKE